jgi:hypothetical protein
MQPASDLQAWRDANKEAVMDRASALPETLNQGALPFRARAPVTAGSLERPAFVRSNILKGGPVPWHLASAGRSPASAATAFRRS